MIKTAGDIVDLSRNNDYRGQNFFNKQNALENSRPVQKTMDYELNFIDKIPDGGKILVFGDANMRIPNLIKDKKPDATIDILDGDKENLLKEFPAEQWKGEIKVQKFQEFDGTKISKDDKYDAIFARRSLFFLEKNELEKVLKQMFLSMKKGGKLYFDYIEPCKEVEELTLIHPLSRNAVEDILKKTQFALEKEQIHDTPYYQMSDRNMSTNIFYATK